jgi:hypothetical protein
MSLNFDFIVPEIALYCRNQVAVRVSETPRARLPCPSIEIAFIPTS